MINKICKTCNVTFLPGIGAKGIYCSKVCQYKTQSTIAKNIAAHKQQIAMIEYEKNPKNCRQCGIRLNFKKRRNIFCSLSCSAIHSNSHRESVITSEYIKSQRARAIAKPSGWAKSRLGRAANKNSKEIRVCHTCNTFFEVYKSNPRLSCSTPCVRTGGAREGSGRAKTGYYNGIYCGSTYELAFLIWHLDHNIDIKRSKEKFSYVFENKSRTYYPDFEVDRVIYEIKGRLSQVDYAKIATCNAVIVCGDDMKPYITYVSKTYNVPKDKLWLLYDKKISKICVHCRNSFQPKTKKGIYCSRSCSLKANRMLDPRRAKR